jgi:serine/threonine protein phosphatase PrpC
MSAFGLPFTGYVHKKSPMICATFQLTETGSQRTRNEDAILCDPQLGLYAVADGLGGLPNGNDASRHAMAIASRLVRSKPKSPLADLVFDLNAELCDAGYALDPMGFGTTLTLGHLFPDDKRMEVAHSGDSALLRLRKGVVETLTTEHTVAAQMVAESFESACEAIPPSAHHTLTQCLGRETYIEPELMQTRVQSGDRYFFLTDGVLKALSPESLKNCLAQDQALDLVCQTLTFQVELAGSPDNYSIVALQFA